MLHHEDSPEQPHEGGDLNYVATLSTLHIHCFFLSVKKYKK